VCSMEPMGSIAGHVIVPNISGNSLSGIDAQNNSGILGITGSISDLNGGDPVVWRDQKYKVSSPPQIFTTGGTFGKNGVESFAIVHITN
jgi:hypothetical protein